jgi:hypothetical protein
VGLVFQGIEIDTVHGMSPLEIAKGGALWLNASPAASTLRVVLGRHAPIANMGTMGACFEIIQGAERP